MYQKVNLSDIELKAGIDVDYNNKVLTNLIFLGSKANVNCLFLLGFSLLYINSFVGSI